MSNEQKAALEIYIRNFAANVLAITEHGFISFDDAVYLLQSDLLEVQHNPGGYCAAMQGICV